MATQPNTGGMGVFAGAGGRAAMGRHSEVYRADGGRHGGRGRAVQGVLYAGLMITARVPS